MYLQRNLKSIANVHDHETRGRDLFYVNKVNKESTKNCIFYDGLVMFNNLPDNIKVSSNFCSFKEGVREYIRTNV